MCNRLFLWLQAAVMGFLVVVPVQAASQDLFAKWQTGAEGLERAMDRRRGTSDAILLYFYTDWCPWCRRFNTEILASEEMSDYLDHVIAVRINPESGKQERAIAERYGVSGYPTLFVLPPGSDQPHEINASRKTNPLNPSEFVRACEQAGERPRKKRAVQSTRRVQPERTVLAASHAMAHDSSPRQAPLAPRNSVTLYLKNGGEVSGELAEETPEQVTLRWDYGETVFRRAEIERMVSGASEQEQPVSAEGQPTQAP
jgi:thiol-disulfide isomerase/thioredoxin